jgi:Ca2+-binding RTX toxin-like protein
LSYLHKGTVIEMSVENTELSNLRTFLPNQRGAFATDYLNLGDGIDTVVLGDEQASYYLANGWLDSVYIDGFNVAEDRLVLHGSSDLYSVSQTDQGSWILFNGDSSNAIAYLKGVFDFNLNAIDFSQVGLPAYQDFSGTEADDLLVGGNGADRLFGFAGHDYAFGGGGRDLFVLGDFGGSYYAQNGWADAVYIDDYTVGVDQLQLQGSASQYSVTSGGQGAWLYCEGDALAYLNGVTSVDLSSFQYISL